MDNENKQIIVFGVGEEEFGIEITKVQEIIRMKELTKLPNSFEFMAGIINLRGNIISVIDLRKRFSLGQELTKDSRIIVVEMDNQNVGLIVDSVSEVINIDSNDIKDTIDKIAGIDNDYLKGIGKIDNRIIILLDINKLLTTEEKLELNQSTNNRQVV